MTARFLAHAQGRLALDEPRLMGIVNVTPDSFSSDRRASDGGACPSPDRAVAHGLRLLEEGASIIDVGGESTRPGAAPVPVEDELRRVLPVVEGLVGAGAVVSIDTRKPEVARRALEAGAAIVNDVEGLRREAMREVVAASRAGVVIMHMQGVPGTMQLDPSYDDVVADVCAYLAQQQRLAEAAGIAPERIALDPGIGFGKTLSHNLALLRGVPQLVALGRPVLIGLSRKSFLARLLGDRTPRERLPGGLAATLIAVAGGARIVRTHDVRPTLDAIAVHRALVDSGLYAG